VEWRRQVRVQLARHFFLLNHIRLLAGQAWLVEALARVRDLRSEIADNDDADADETRDD